MVVRITLTKAIDVLPSPVADFTIDDTCFGDSTLFAQNVDLPIDTYLANTDWLIDGQLYSGDETNHKFLNSDTYDVELYVRASNLCPDNIEKIYYN